MTDTSPLETDPARVRWHVVPSSAWLGRALDWVIRAAASALEAQDTFNLVLAGGGTPEKLYRVLAEQTSDWSRWHIWFGDERCLPPGDTQRNSHMAKTAWLDRVAIPAENIHVIPAELGAVAASASYNRELFGQPDFDLVLLGLGQDGHTASLFPEHVWGLEPDSPDVLPVFDAPKPPPHRVSLSAHRLSQARCVLFLACGTEKRPALTAWRQGSRIPASVIQPQAGVDLLIDTDACPPGENQ